MQLVQERSVSRRFRTFNPTNGHESTRRLDWSMSTQLIGYLLAGMVAAAILKTGTTASRTLAVAA